jgi:hypothetical protein
MATRRQVAKKLDPALWQRCRREAISSMGGVFSARAMQLATRLYKARGGRYEGAKPRRAANSLSRWTAEKWDYAGKHGQSRYLPQAVRERLTQSEKARTNRAKRSASGQWSRQPADVAAKAATIRKKLWAPRKKRETQRIGGLRTRLKLSKGKPRLAATR